MNKADHSPKQGGQMKQGRRSGFLLGMLAAFFLLLPSANLFALPSGEDVVSGTAVFESADDGATLNITASENSIIEYQTFDIAAGETVNFLLPSADSFSLNRILGAASEIYGTLNANGNLILVNENGFYFSSSASVSAAGFIASAHDISNENFLSGDYLFGGLDQDVNPSHAFILNEGTIRAGEGGMAVLIGDAVENRGYIEAPLGTVTLAAGRMVTVGILEGGMISVAVDEATAREVVNRDGETVAEQVRNSGTLDGGTVQVTAEAMDRLFESAINLEGFVNASGFESGEAGTVHVVSSGSIQVNGGVSAPQGEIRIEAGEDLQVEGRFEAAEGRVSLTAGGTLTAGAVVTEGETELRAGGDLRIEGDITTSGGNLTLAADADGDGSGAFLQAAGSVIETTDGDIAISASGESTLGTIRSAGNLTLAQAGAPVRYTQHQGTTVTTGGSLAIEDGVTLRAQDGIYEVGGSWSNQGLFEAGTSMVRLTGSADAYVLGSTDFYDFAVIEPGKTVYFQAGQTQTVAGVLTLRGEYGRLILLRSTQADIPWKIDAVGLSDVAYVDLKDSTNVNIHGPPIALATSKNSLNNTGWDFSQAGPLWTNTSGNSLWSDADNWDGGFLPGPGDIVRFTGTSSDAFVDTLFGAAIGGILLDSGYAGTVTLERDLTVAGDVVLRGGILAGGSQTLTVSGDWIRDGGAFQYDTSTVVFDDASRISVISGDNTFYHFESTTSSKILAFGAGDTQTILGNWLIRGAFTEHVRMVSTEADERWFVRPLGEIDISYAWVEGSENLEDFDIIMTESTNRDASPGWDPTGTWTNGGGDGLWSNGNNWSGLGGGVAPGSGDDVVFDGTNSSDSTIDSSFAGAITSLTIQSGYTGTITMQRDLSVNGGYTQTGGTFVQGTHHLYLEAYNQSGGTFTGGAGTLDVAMPVDFSGSTLTFTVPALFRVGGDFTVASGFAGTFDASTGLVYFYGTVGDQTLTPRNITFRDVEISNASGDLIVDGTLQVGGSLTVTQGGLDLNTNDASIETFGDVTFAATGTSLDMDMFNSASHWVFSGTGTITAEAVQFQYVQIGVNASLTLATDLYIQNGFSVQSGGTTALNLADFDLYMRGSSIDFTNLDTLTSPANSSVIFDSSVSLNPGSVAFGNVQIGTAIATGSVSVSTNNWDVNGSFTTGSVDLNDLSMMGHSLFVAGAVVDIRYLSSDLTNTTLVFDGSTDATLITGGHAISNVQINKSGGGTVELTDSVIVGNNLTVTQGVLDIAGQSLTVVTNFVNNGTVRLQGGETISTSGINDTNGLVVYTGSGTYTDLRLGDSYYNLEFDGTGTWTLDADLNAAGLTLTAGTVNTAYTVTLTGSYLQNGGTLTTSGGSGESFTVPGSFTMNGGTFNSGSTLSVMLNMTLNSGVFNMDDNVVTVAQNLNITAGTFNGGASGLNVDGDFSLGASGTFSAPMSFTLAGDFNNGGGTFTHNNMAVTLDGGSQSIYGSTTFHDLTKDTSGTVALYFEQGETTTVTGKLILRTTGGDLNIASLSPGNQFNLNATGSGADAPVLDHLSVTDSNAVTPLVATNSSLGTNNSGWSLSGSVYTWLGLSTAWNSTSNWDQGSVPQAGDTVVIPDVGAISAPSINANSEVGDLTIQSSGILNMSTFTLKVDSIAIAGTLNMGSAALTVTGNWTMQSGGTFNAVGTVIFEGDTQLTSMGTVFADIQLGTGSSGGTLTLLDDLEISGDFSVLNGNTTTFDLNGQTAVFNSNVDFTNLDVFGVSGSTAVFNGSTNLTSAGRAFNDVELAAGATLTAIDSMDINGDFSVTGGSSTFDITGRIMNFAGDVNLSNLGTFTSTNSVAVFDGTTSLISNGKAFNEVQIATGGTLSLADTAEFNGNFSATGGSSTFTMTSQTASFGGALDLGTLVTLNATGSTLILDGTTTQTFTTGGFTFNDINIANTGGAAVTVSGNLDVNGNLSVTNGQLNMNTNNPDLTLGGSLSVTGSGSWSKGTGTLTFNDEGTVAGTLGSGGFALEDLVIGNGRTITLSEALTTDGLTVQSGGTFRLMGNDLSFTASAAASNSGTIVVFGNENYTNVTHLGVTSGTVRYTGDGNAVDNGPFTVEDFVTAAGSPDYYHLVIDSVDNNDTFDLTGSTLNVAGNFTVSNGTLDNASDIAVTVSGNTTLANDEVAFGANIWTLDGDFDFSALTTVTISLTNVRMTGSAPVITAPGDTLAQSLYTLTVPSGTTLTVSGNLGLRGLVDVAGTLSTGSRISVWGTTGDVTLSSTGSITGAGTLRVNDGAAISNMSGGTIDISTLEIVGTHAGNIYPQTYDSATVTFVNDAGQNDIFTGSSGTTTFSGNVTVQNDATGDYTFRPLGTWVLQGNFALSDTGTGALSFDTGYASPDLDFFGNVVASGTVTGFGGTGTITLRGSSGTQTLNFNGATLTEALVINAAGATKQFTGSVTVPALTVTAGTAALAAGMDVNGTLTIGGSGILNGGSQTIYVSGNWINGGTFTPGSSTVILDGTTQTITGANTFQNLTRLTAGTLTFPASTTQVITGALILNGAGAGSLLNLRSSSGGTPWSINAQGTRDLTYLDVMDSNNTNATAMDCSTGCTDSTGNTAWTFAGGGADPEPEPDPEPETGNDTTNDATVVVDTIDTNLPDVTDTGLDSFDTGTGTDTGSGVDAGTGVDSGSDTETGTDGTGEEPLNSGTDSGTGTGTEGTGGSEGGDNPQDPGAVKDDTAEGETEGESGGEEDAVEKEDEGQEEESAEEKKEESAKDEESKKKEEPQKKDKSESPKGGRSEKAGSEESYRENPWQVFGTEDAADFKTEVKCTEGEVFVRTYTEPGVLDGAGMSVGANQQAQALFGETPQRAGGV